MGGESRQGSATGRVRVSRDRLPNRWRDRDGERRNRPARSERPDRPVRPPGSRERPETLDRIEQRPRFEPHPPEWGRPDFTLGQRVEWNFVYKIANSQATRGTITRVGETCDIRWDDGLETVFMPPLVLQAASGEEAGRTAEAPSGADPDDSVVDDGEP